MKRKGDAQSVDLESLTAEQRAQLKQEIVAEKRAKSAERAKANQPRELNRKTKARQPSIGMSPSSSSKDALVQAIRGFGDAWLDDPANPAVELVSSESHISGRITTYAEGRWQHRRVGSDAVILVVKLQDGTQETRRFSRGVIDAKWSRS